MMNEFLAAVTNVLEKEIKSAPIYGD